MARGFARLWAKGLMFKALGSTGFDYTAQHTSEEQTEM